MHRFILNILYEAFAKNNYCINNYCIILLFLILLSLSCKKRGDQTSSICFPYRISNKIVTRTEYPKEFGMISSSINADIEYHVLPDVSMHSYITIQGPENFVNKINCISIYNSHYNRNEISFSYDRCLTRRKNPKLYVHIYGHELFEISMIYGNFSSKDTIRSNDGFISCSLFNGSRMDILCSIPILRLFIYNNTHFNCQGIVDSCHLYMLSSQYNSPVQPVNLEHLKYRSLYYYVPNDEGLVSRTTIYAGRPDTIYHRINSNEYNLYYQGDPLLIDKGSRFFNLFKKD